MVALAQQVETDADRVAILLVALKNAVGVIEASDNLLSVVDPKYDGTPPCIGVWRDLVESMRSDCCPKRTRGAA